MKKEIKKNTDEVLQEIEMDDILKELKEDLVQSYNKAVGFREIAEKREHELLFQLEHINSFFGLGDDLSIEAIENNAANAETSESILKKISAIRKIKNKSWTDDKTYRESMAKYLTYITPIFTDIETQKKDIRKRMCDIQKRFNIEMGLVRKEYGTCESKIKELLGVAKIAGNYIFQVSHEREFGRHARSDVFTHSQALSYYPKASDNKKPVKQVQVLSNENRIPILHK